LSNSLILAALAGGCILAWVLYLYRKGRLREDNALLWIFVSAAIIVVSTWTDLLFTINWVVGAEKASDVVLGAFVAFLLIFGIYYSIKISDLTEQNRKIAQEIAVIKTLKSSGSNGGPKNDREDED
jgi:hypothetical protein